MALPPTLPPLAWLPDRPAPALLGPGNKNVIDSKANPKVERHSGVCTRRERMSAASPFMPKVAWQWPGGEGECGRRLDSRVVWLGRATAAARTPCPTAQMCATQQDHDVAAASRRRLNAPQPPPPPAWGPRESPIATTAIRVSAPLLGDLRHSWRRGHVQAGAARTIARGNRFLVAPGNSDLKMCS